MRILRNKRGQGLSITTIIVAAIALVVLVVLIAIFTGRIGGFSSGVGSIGDATKTCFQQTSTQPKTACSETEQQIASSDASAQGLVCCKPIQQTVP